MENQLLTLSKIFTERLFRIPDYQRGYAWSEKQLKDFWSDLEQIDSDNHYTGVLTLETVPEEVYKKWSNDYWIINSRNYEPLYVVDGQQRLTTSIILIQAILESIPDDISLNFTTKNDIIKKYIFDSKDGGISRSYIFGYEYDNPSYEFLITRIFKERISNPTYQETTYTQNLENAKKFFKERIIGLEFEKVEKLYTKITQKLLFNIFTITKDVDVCVAFETMNNRGKPLSHLELLKNRLIFLSLKLHEEESEKIRLRTAINDCWKSIYHNLGRNKDKPLQDDDFLLMHYLTYYGRKLLLEEKDNGLIRMRLRENQHNQDLLEKQFIIKNLFLPENDSNKITLNSIYQYVSSLQDSVVVWYKMWNPFDSDYSNEEKIWLDKIQRQGYPLFQPLLLAFLKQENDPLIRIRLLKVVERSIFVRSLTSWRYLPGHQAAFPWIVKISIDFVESKISSEHLIKNINDQTQSVIKDSAFTKLMIDEFKSSGFYQWEGIRYFLYEYNLALQERSKTQREKIFWPEFNEVRSDFISVEHIYPKQARAGYWQNKFKAYNQKQKALLRDSLGNLLPLSKPKNSSLSNKPFPEKVTSNNNSIGYMYGCYAENEISKEPDWTPEHILKRGIKLLTFMEKRWGLEIGDNIQKKQMLGLDFMVDAS